VLPVVESPADIIDLAARLGEERAIPVLAGIESIRGVIDCVVIAAAPSVLGVYFGAEDFTADMGARRTTSSTEVLYARSRVVLAAKVDHARQLIADYDSAKATGRGAIDFEGKMVDEPILKRAHGILRAASRQ
jgi:citrate lyase subunit beta / citryl-CoA lyase